VAKTRIRARLRARAYFLSVFLFILLARESAFALSLGSGA
jgi:hypothetical protein